MVGEEAWWHPTELRLSGLMASHLTYSFLNYSYPPSITGRQPEVLRGCYANRPSCGSVNELVGLSGGPAICWLCDLEDVTQPL